MGCLRNPRGQQYRAARVEATKVNTMTIDGHDETSEWILLSPDLPMSCKQQSLRIKRQPCIAGNMTACNSAGPSTFSRWFEGKQAQDGRRENNDKVGLAMRWTCVRHYFLRGGGGVACNEMKPRCAKLNCQSRRLCLKKSPSSEWSVSADIMGEICGRFND